MSLTGKVALVTGASRGIGKAIALTLGQQGATVLGTATTPAGAEAIGLYLKEAGISGQGLSLNVAEPGQIDEALSRIEKEFGSVAILVNNAGITRDNLLMRMKDEEWNAIMATNLTPVFQLSRGVIRGMMKSRWGRIINITSVVGAMGNAGQTNYAAAKAGLTGFTKALAREVGSRQITVNCIAPGFIDTDMTKSLPQEQRDGLVQAIALGRLGQPEDIADAVAFIASDRAGYITGTTLHVNGGMYMA